jgi:hypothetical protein
MVLARFRMLALTVTIGAAAVALPLLSLAVPAQAAAGASGGGYTSARPGAASVANNPDFAGYVAAVAPGSATSAAAQFKVPRLSCTAASRGITPGVLVLVNNFRSESSAYLFVLCIRGRAVYFPALDVNRNEVNYTTSFHAGDVVKVSAKVTTRGTTVQITDVTRGVTKRRTGPGARPSAVFVGDDSVFLGTTRLGVPNFGTLTFTSCLVDGRALAHLHPVRAQRVNSRNVVQIATGALSPGGRAFATHFRHF